MFSHDTIFYRFVIFQLELSLVDFDDFASANGQMIGVANGELFTYADNVDAETVTRWVTVAPEVIVISVALLRGERQTFAVAHSDRLQMQRLTFKELLAAHERANAIHESGTDIRIDKRAHDQAFVSL